MITDAFSLASEPIISLDMLGPQRHLTDTCIITFSDVIMRSVLDAFAWEEAGGIRTCGGVTPLYLIKDRERKIGFFQAHTGSAMAGSDLIEANWYLGATSFIVFGSCGCVNKEAAQGKYVIPTAAYRDEGMSYHYAPPADYIQMPGWEKTEKVFQKLCLPYALGKTWTTDAFYRELRHQMLQRKEEGCLAVDMEAAGLQAVCDFHRLNLYCFLMCGDVLDSPSWDEGALRQANHHLNNFDIALSIAREIASCQE